jgi:predicted alpha/beta-fold hydrolase
MKHFLCLVLILFSLTSNAKEIINYGGWPSEAWDLKKTYYFPFPEPYVGTLWGNKCQDRKFDKTPADISEALYQAPNLYTEQKYLTVKIQIRTDKDKKPMPGPLMVLIPGAFANLDDHAGINWSHRFIALGYHVLTVPNPWGTDFVSHKAAIKLGDFEKEAKALYQSIRTSIEYLENRELIDGEISMTGLSYGAFLSAMIKAVDSEHQNPLIDGNVTLFGPPFSLGRTLERLDDAIDEIRQDYLSTNLMYVYYKLRMVCALSNIDDLTQLRRHDSKGLVTRFAFHEEMIRSLTLYNKLWNLDLIPTKRSEREAWRIGMDFRTYFSRYAPELLSNLYSEKTRVSYWIGRAISRGFNNIRLHTAEDDFLNDEKVWPAFRNDFYLVDHGGHLGYQYLPWLDQLLKKTIAPEMQN